MHVSLENNPSFGSIHLKLEPGESIVAESGAMICMSSGLEMKSRLNGSFFSAILKRLFGDESLFVNCFYNNTKSPLELVLGQVSPGEIIEHEIKNEKASFFAQPGAFVACAGDIKIGIKWSGFASWFAREGLFKLNFSGRGKVWLGAYGKMLTKKVVGELIVDTSHLVAWTSGVNLRVGVPGSLWTSLTSGEGFVTRVSGNGSVIIQTRSESGFVSWINPKL